MRPRSARGAESQDFVRLEGTICRGDNTRQKGTFSRFCTAHDVRRETRVSDMYLRWDAAAGPCMERPSLAASLSSLGLTEAWRQMRRIYTWRIEQHDNFNFKLSCPSSLSHLAIEAIQISVDNHATIHIVTTGRLGAPEHALRTPWTAVAATAAGTGVHQGCAPGALSREHNSRAKLAYLETLTEIGNWNTAVRAVVDHTRRATD